MSLNVSSLYFNGSNQYGKLNLDASIRNRDNFTVGVAFTVGPLATDPTKHHAYVERQGTGTGIRFRITPVKDKLQFGFAARDGDTDTSYTYNTKWDDRWHFAAFTARLTGDKPTYEIILDGISVSKGTLVLPDGVEKVSDTAPKGIYIGNHSRLASGESFPANTAWNGYLDELVVFNNSQGAGAILDYINSDDHFEVITDPDDTEMIAYYQFNQNTGSTITNVTVSPNTTGTLYQSGVPSSAMWTINRPFLGDGLKDTTAPTIPVTNVHTNVTEDGFDTSWAASTDNVFVQFYELQVSPFNSFSTYTAYDTAQVTNQKVRGLLPATNYYWRVRAFDAELNASGYSTVRSLTTLSLGDVTPPNPPTNLTPSFVTHSSFRVSFTPSVSGDVVGYKIDVSTDADFDVLLDSYRNEDIGNVTFKDIFGTSALTSYWVRIRAYDAYDNESNDSIALRVNTPRQPDVTPPLVATLHDASGISSKAATLSWDEGIDDVAVVGYYLDISTASNFATYVTASSIYYNNLDVGKIENYRVEGLDPDTTYYYRVRAYDDAGNIADNVTSPIEFRTNSPSVYEDGYLDTTEIRSTWKSGSNLEAGIIEVNASSAAKFEFDLSNIVGSFSSVIFRFMPRPSVTPTTFGDIEVRAQIGDLSTTLSGSVMNFTISQVDEAMEIDVTPLFTTNGVYVVEIKPTAIGGFSGFLDSGLSVEIFNDGETYAPALDVRSDALSSTSPLPFVINTLSYERINQVTNPSFEIDFTGWAFTSAAGTIKVGGTDGDDYAEISGSSALGYIASTITIPVAFGETIQVALDSKWFTGTTQNLRLELRQMNASDVDMGTNASMQTTYTPTSSWKTTTASWTNNVVGCVGIRIRVYNISAGAYAYGVDNFFAEITTEKRPTFTGNRYGEWIGSANLSKSRHVIPTFQFVAPYLGDNNDSNDASAFFKRHEDQYWTAISGTHTVNRSLKTHSFVWGPFILDYNIMPNPSFEIDEGWGVGYTLDDTASGQRSYRVTSNEASSYHIPVSASTQYSFVGRIRTGPSVLAKVRFTGYTSGDVQTFVADTVGIYSQDYFTEDKVQFTTTATTAYVIPSLIVDGESYFDCFQLNEGEYRDYRDGTYDDAMWLDVPHSGKTVLRMLPETVYDLKVLFSDNEGFFDETSVTTYSYQESYVTAPRPDNLFTALGLDIVPSGNSLLASLRYSGDDNKDATVRMEFKRSDLPSWSEVPVSYNRNLREISSNITNLKYGTNYTVRAIISDPDGVYGAINNIVTNTASTIFATESIETDPFISFGGFALMGRNDGKILVTKHNAFGFPERRIDVEDIPRQDGSVEMQAFWGKRTIQMEGVMWGDSRTELLDIRDSLAEGLNDRQQRLVVDTLGSTGRFYYATCTGLDAEEDSDSITHLRWSTTFICADPFAYDINETIVPTFTTTNNGEISLTNGGSTFAFPTAIITTTSAFPVTMMIANETTGERLAPKSTIITGDRLIFDSSKKSLTKNGIEIDYAGTFPRISKGGNMFVFTLTSPSGTPSISVDIRWRAKYL